MAPDTRPHPLAKVSRLIFCFELLQAPYMVHVTQLYICRAYPEHAAIATVLGSRCRLGLRSWVAVFIDTTRRGVLRHMAVLIPLPVYLNKGSHRHFRHAKALPNNRFGI